MHRTVERSAWASFGGWDGEFSGRVRVAIYENPQSLNVGTSVSARHPDVAALSAHLPTKYSAGAKA